MKKIIGMLLFCISPWWLVFGSDKQAAYVGANSCKNCHSAAYVDWTESDHYMAMQPAQAPFVKGNFADASVEFNGVTTGFFIKDDLYMVQTVDENNKPRQYPIKYTFGFYPLQQYLIELEGGFIQALNIAWDNRPAEQGGQKWFHLREEENVDAEHPFFWTRHFQN